MGEEIDTNEKSVNRLAHYKKEAEELQKKRVRKEGGEGDVGVVVRTAYQQWRGAAHQSSCALLTLPGMSIPRVNALHVLLDVTSTLDHTQNCFH